MPWTDGLDEATIGHASLNGWKADGNPEDIARAAVAAHLSASKIIGADPNSFLKFPSDPKDEAGWAAVHERLGVPKDGKYEVKGLDEDSTRRMVETAARLKLTPAQTEQLAADFLKWSEDADAADTSAAGIKRASEEVELRQAWASNYDAFKFQTDRAAALLGLSPEMVEAMEGQLGLMKFREQLRVFAKRTGETEHVGGDAGGNKAMTREEAVAERGRLMADQGWVQRYMAGDKEARETMEGVNRAIVGMPHAA